jgi:molybdopterin-biosynthesis enzyme MoeA-like protein
MNFYSVIIGTELLNGRREDAHFSFLNSELLKRGWIHKGSFVIKDEPDFIKAVFELVKSDPKSVMFSFGGIGATPDDYTRECAAKVFTDGKMEINEGAKAAIIERFGQKDAYPHRINMAHLPINAGLLKNVVSNVPGFYVDKRFFFVPGFPSMATHMIVEALEKYYPQNQEKTYKKVLSATASENEFINTMKEVSEKVDLSSLPIMEGDKRYCVLSISSNSEELTNKEFEKFVEYCKDNNIEFVLEDIRQKA